MNVIQGQIEEIFVNDGMTMGNVSVRGAYVKVLLTFLMSAKVGDTIVIESGVAISKLEQEHVSEI
jgi:hydrogenase maturation factor